MQLHKFRTCEKMIIMREERGGGGERVREGERESDTERENERERERERDVYIILYLMWCTSWDEDGISHTLSNGPTLHTVFVIQPLTKVRVQVDQLIMNRI